MPGIKAAQHGFTLIELLIVFAISAFLSSLTIASFAKYNNSQVFQNAVSNVQSVLSSAKSNSLSGIVPTQCQNIAFNGYQFAITSTTTYELDAVCQGKPVAVSKIILPTGVAFSTASLDILFQPINGQVNGPAKFSITGEGMQKTITVGPEGIVTISMMLRTITIQKLRLWNTFLITG